MSWRLGWIAPRMPYVLAAALVAISLWGESPLHTPRQSGGCFRQSSVGGVAIDPSGLIKNIYSDPVAQAELRRARDAAAQDLPTDLQQPSPMRKVSLRRLEAAIADHLANGAPLPDEMLALAGLQDVRYVFVYPEQNDIVLAGFGEGWKIDDRGNAVGLTTGRPVLLLDDLLTALRTAATSAGGQMSCSIDPTSEGLERLRRAVATMRTAGDLRATAATIEQALGPQVISIQGVSGTSHLAMVMVAADYRMKRLGMGLDRSPVRGLPSYLEMAPSGGRGMSAMAPRWWMVPHFEPLRTDGQGLAWELPSGSVKVLTEETHFAANGAPQQTGSASPAAQRWADLMTQKYDDLAREEPVFGQLRNVMQLAVVAALIVKEDLAGKAGLPMAQLLDASAVPTLELAAPKQTDSVASAVKKGNQWVIGASGGVQIESGTIVERRETRPELAQVRQQLVPQPSRWWWD